MEDSIDCVENDDKGVEFCRQLEWQSGDANMQAKKWISKLPKDVEAILTDECATEIVINNGQDPITKTLWISWNSIEDVFTVSASPVSSEFQKTKQNVLRKVAAIFCPLGLYARKWLLQRLYLGRRNTRWNSEWKRELVRAVKRSGQGEDSPMSADSRVFEVEAHRYICWYLSQSLWCSCLYPGANIITMPSPVGVELLRN